MLSDLPPEQRWRNQSTPAPIVVALLERRFASSPGAEAQPHMLLIKRNSRPYKGQWALVGGKWDFGETMPAAIEREVLEETGLHATFITLRGLVSERLFPAHAQELGAHFLILVCELHAPAGEPREQSEGAVAWFTWPEIERLHAAAKIVPSDYAMIRYFRDRTAATTAHIEAEMFTAVQDDGSAPPTLVRFDPVMPPPARLPPGQFLGQTVTVAIDRPLGSRHPQWGFIYPLNYGRVPGIPSGDGEDLDAYVLGVYEPLDTFSGRCIAILQRRDDDDDKLILAPPGVTFSDEQILALTAFQERFFDPVILRAAEN